MTDLKSLFDTAAKEVQELPERPDSNKLLELYALYKQATAGDVSGERPGLMDFTGGAKYDAWEKLKGTAAEQAMQKYVDLVNSLKA
jgi:acyl-CoA-binding protein